MAKASRPMTCEEAVRKIRATEPEVPAVRITVGSWADWGHPGCEPLEYLLEIQRTFGAEPEQYMCLGAGLDLMVSQAYVRADAKKVKANG